MLDAIALISKEFEEPATNYRKKKSEYFREYGSSPIYLIFLYLLDSHCNYSGSVEELLLIKR